MQPRSGILHSLEAGLRAGGVSKVRKALLTVNISKLKREELLQVSNLARRAGVPLIALRALGSIVHQNREIHSPATVEELASYAIALHKVGASGEAQMLLKPLNGKTHPQVLLYRAFVHFSKWEYREPIHDLQQFIEAKGLSSYERLVGQLNLAAAFVTEELYTDAETLLSNIFSIAKQHSFSAVYSSALELSAQLSYARRDFQRGLKYLTEARELTEAQTEAQLAWVDKWQCLIELAQHGVTSSGLDRLHKIRAASILRGDSETCRECDLREAILSQNLDLFVRVYAGTPFSAYRKRMFRLWTPMSSLPQTLRWTPPGSLVGHGELDLQLGRTNTGIEVKPGQSTHRLLWAMSLDFYRHSSVGSLFHVLFADQYFDPETSRDRVQAIIYRSREWLQQNKITLSIQMRHANIGGQYYLESSPNFGLRVFCERGHAPPTNEEVMLSRIETTWSQNKFTASEACKKLGLSLGTVVSILNWGQERNLVQKIGQRRQTQYLILKRTGSD